MKVLQKRQQFCVKIVLGYTQLIGKFYCHNINYLICNKNYVRYYSR
jgi:hypothetical protein